MWEIIAIIATVVLALVWFVIGLTRPRDMREDQYRDNGEFDGHIVTKDWNKKK